MKRTTLAAVLLLSLAVACFRAPEAGAPGGQGAPAGPGPVQRLSIATGGTGGVYFVYGGGLAEQITQNLEGFEATAEVTSASVDNMFLIADESSDLAFTLADTASDAINGEGAFEEPVPAQALANLYVNYTQLVTTADTGIASVADLRGRRVSVGAPNSGTEVIALRILGAAGLNPDSDITRGQLGVDDSVQALRDGGIDAFFWSGGLPTGAVTDLASTDPIVMVPTAEYVGALQDQYGRTYMESTIPADIYPGMSGDVATIGVPNYLVVNEAIDEELAYQITRLLFERKDALVAVHPEAENLDVQNAQQVEPLALHAGAQRYYAEAG
jgi:TRAP transporter TAXI family solute receptor